MVNAEFCFAPIVIQAFDCSPVFTTMVPQHVPFSDFYSKAFEDQPSRSELPANV